MVTLAVLVILVSIGAPELSRFIAQRAVVAQADTLSAALQFARSEAMKRGLPVTMCHSADPAAATPVCAASDDWSTGWVIFVDRLGTAGAYDNGEEILRVQQGITSGGLTLTDSKASITFNAMGMARGDPISFGVSPKGGSTAEPMNRCVSLSAQGRVNPKLGACAVKKSAPPAT